ncbi:MAG TPA: tetratricopeptide repeat protein [Smithella sp.]|nr:tetratricopeptide repeat protein [Smithella sp.]
MAIVKNIAKFFIDVELYHSWQVSAMMKMSKPNTSKQNMIIQVILIMVTLAVYWQVNQYDFIIEDYPHLAEGSHVQSGITMEGIRWAFSTTYYYLWQPLFWLSFMLDYHLYGLNAGGYHLTNLVLHVFNMLLLFHLLNRMTGDVWKSALVAACFALHPLNVESVAWISQRKNVLCVFFWMLTLWLYVYYTEKPVIKRYLLVICAFALALMSKPMVVTLPIVMMLLDYWPLKRFETRTANFILWQLREKAPFLVLSIVVSIITLYAQHYNPSDIHIDFTSKFSGAVFAFVTYLEKIFWPHDLAFCHPSSVTISLGQAWGYAALIVFISAVTLILIKPLPFLFVGWMWYAVTLFPVIGIIHSKYVPFMFDHFTYLPSIGIFVALAWGMPFLFRRQGVRKKVLFPAAIMMLLMLAVLTAQQCSYWKNSITLFHHTLKITENNVLAHHHLGYVYDNLGRYQLAVHHYTEAIRIQPHRASFYNNRGVAFSKMGQYQSALHDYHRAIQLNPDFPEAYINRGAAYLMRGHNDLGCSDAQRACELGNCTLIETAKKNGYCH